METRPPPKEIKKWLIEHDPLGLFHEENFSIQDIDPKPWSGHFNFLISVEDKKFVLRFKGPEWGDTTTGILDECEILQAVEKHKVGPRVFYLTKDFFGEPMIFEEYIEGKLVDETDFGEIARFIVKINSIELSKNVLDKQERLFSYEKHKKTWRNRLKIILENEHTKEWGEQIKKILPRGDIMLNRFEERLTRAIKESGPVFVFKSAHAGHLLKTNEGFRFFNWEKNGYGDPSFTLAVFLASINTYPDFEKNKKEMVGAYLKEKHISELEKLVEQRLQEREISNLLWVLWAHARQNSKQIDSRDIQERFIRVRNILRD